MRIFIFASLIIFMSYLLWAQQVEALVIGRKAPTIEAVDNSGNAINSDELVKKGKVVVIFYRGAWCPYCQRHMAAMQDSLEMVLNKGASVIVVTPETNESIGKMVEKSGATFSIVNDENYTIMNNYKVAYHLTKQTVPKYFGPVVNRTRKANGNDDDILPVPATYILDEDHKVIYAHFDKDYSQRSTVAEILSYLW